MQRLTGQKEAIARLPGISGHNSDLEDDHTPVEPCPPDNVSGSEETQCYDLQSSLRGLRITHAALLSDFSALQADCKILQTSYGALQAECGGLQSTITRLSSTIEHYKRNIDILKGDITILKGRNGRMAQRVEELEAENLTRHPEPLPDEVRGDSHLEGAAQLKSSELEKMTSDLANLRQDLAVAKQAQQQAEVQVRSAEGALLHAQGARDKAHARLVDAEKRATSAEARAAAADESAASARERAAAAEESAASARERAAAAEGDAASAQERAAAAEESAASARERAAAAEGDAASAQERAAAAEESAASARERAAAAEGESASAQERASVAEERERAALAKLTVITADVASAKARADDAEARATAIAEDQRIIKAAHEQAELNASQAAVRCKQAQKDRADVEAECVRLRGELNAQNSIISSIKAQVASAPGCSDQQADTEVLTAPHAYTPSHRPTTAAPDADCPAQTSADVATETMRCAPVTVRASIDPRDAGENESGTEVQQQDNPDVSLGEDGNTSSRGTPLRKRRHREEGTVSASDKRQCYVRVPESVSTGLARPVASSSASRSPARSKQWTRKSLPKRKDNIPSGIQYDKQGVRICGWCNENQEGKLNPRWCPSELGSGSICQRCWKKACKE